MHPETGELLATEAQWRAALQAVEERLSSVYQVRRVLQEEHAERYPSPSLPAATRRTPTQERVARCPRCGLRLEEEGGSS